MERTVPPNTLTFLAYNEVKAFFKEKDHQPSSEMYQGLYNLQDTLTRMLSGDLDEKYYLSSLDPGVGKTSAIKAWLHVYLKRRTQYGDRGVIICFDRLDEIEQFIRSSAMPEDVYGVLVSGSTSRGIRLNDMGVGVDSLDSAVVLLTTKQQIIKRTRRGRAFGGVSRFYYQGAPRVVRIWDESMTVGRSLTLCASQILELVHTISRVDVGLSLRVQEFALSLGNCSDKAILSVPDLGGLELGYNFRWRDSTMRDTAETLALLSGRVVTVRVDGVGRVALDCVQSLPEDFKPCLVTDASVRIRETYRLQETYRGDVERLTPVTSCKRYDNLKVFVWHRRTGKQSYRIEGVEEVAKEVAKVVAARTREAFLIVVTKENRTKMSGALKRELPSADYSRLQFLTWGMHLATNDYVDIPNVVITSQLYYRPADYEAGARAAATLTTSDGQLSEEVFQAFRKGETAHHLLQCICRGAVRKAIGNQCPPSRCWIISARGMKVEEQLPDIFPGCSVEPWENAPVAFKEIKLQVLGYILDCLGAGVERIKASAVRTSAGIKSVSNFKRDYLTDSRFMALCNDHGVIILHENSRYFFEMNPFRMQ
ncbi:hypothetical protein Gbem_1745 [Citrifermentans bemidjiense Bem]|uniref:Uncharacterized protein n=1 Tax=Citrifermentans bemidjiense (strain ATCC BAA-1014 / DSM 16622 / JCM 12645 / Bem) TaxID=404380 RepID=B5EA55_CITBB|nr:hypothetical protein [Citrifermentans bemidjiense]ACH38761.1 hypothetical protein Gbem_1745 [Citrifermentans bemidjiense Bem]